MKLLLIRDKDHLSLESQIYDVMVLQLYFPNQAGTTLLYSLVKAE